MQKCFTNQILTICKLISANQKYDRADSLQEICYEIVRLHFKQTMFQV